MIMIPSQVPNHRIHILRWLGVFISWNATPPSSERVVVTMLRGLVFDN